jgi:serine protease Do
MGVIKRRISGWFGAGIALFMALWCCASVMAQLPRPEARPPSQSGPSSAASAANAPNEPPSALGRQVLDKVRPSVVQIKAFFGENTEKASHGSGFVVGQNGLAITNYHVVSDVVMFPDKYRLEYKTTQGKVGKVEVLAIDVRHDVSLVRLVDLSLSSVPPLALATAIPPKGERAYSVGFPLDVGLTITEGVSNGLVEESFGERLHYAGAINGGMSGGPALDAQGRVIGVNVSAYRFQQSVSFLVPVRHASALLAQAYAKPQPLMRAEARKEVSRQLLAHAKDLLSVLPEKLPTQTLRGVSLPTKIMPFFDCGASGDPDSDSPVQTQRSSCAAKAGLYLNPRLYGGDINFNHQLFSTSKLDAYRFSKHMQRFSGASTGISRGFNRSEYGPSSCESRMINNNGINLFAEICTRAYRKLEDVFDVSLRVVSSSKPREGFTSNLELTGMPYGPAMAFAQRYLAAIKPGADK